MIDAFFAIFTNTDNIGKNIDNDTSLMTPKLQNIIAFLNTLLALEKPYIVKMRMTNLIIRSPLNAMKVD